MTQQKFCHACGSPLSAEADFCSRCGTRLTAAAGEAAGVSEKKILPAFLFAFLIGPLGIHRFYVGKVGTGIVMLLLTITVIGVLVTGFWALIDWIVIVSGNFRDKEGKILKQWT